MRFIKADRILFLIITSVFFINTQLISSGPRFAIDFPYISIDEFESFLPQSWNTMSAAGFGEPGLIVLWSYPIRLIYQLYLYFSGTSSLFVILLGVLPAFLIAFWSVNSLLCLYKIKSDARYLSAFLYITSTYFLLLIDGGQLSIALAYSFFPFVVLMYHNALKGNTLRGIYLGVSLALLGYFDIRYLFIFGIFVFLHVFYTLISLGSYEILVRFFKTITTATIIFLLFHAFWLIPSIFSRSQLLPTSYDSVDQLTLLSFASLGHAFSNMQPHWYNNVFGHIALPSVLFLPYVLIFIVSPLYSRPTKLMGLWLVLSIVGIFFTKGATPPFANLNIWFFENVPGFSLFRDPTKFFVLISLSLSVVGAFLFNSLNKIHLLLLSMCFVIYVVLLLNPLWRGLMTGIYSSPVYIKEFENVEHVVKNDKDYSRILWIPSRQPLAYSSISHPTIEASRLVQLRPFQSSIIGGYELFNFLRDSEVTKELLDISSIGYVAYPFPDARRLNLKKDNIEYYNTFNSQMKDASWFGEELSNPPVSLLKTKNSQDKMFLTQKSFYVIGSDQLYFDLNKLNLLDLSKNAFFFGELAPKSIADANNIQTVLYKKELIDLAMTGVDGDNFVFPASFLENNPNGNGWWKRDSYRYIDVRAFLQEKYSLDTLDFDYGGGWSFSEGNLENTFTSPKFKKGKMLYARVMTSTRSGKIEFYQGDSLIGLISTGIDEPERLQLTLKGWDSIPDKIIDLENGNFRWFEIGKLESDNFLTIKTYGDINIVNSLVVEDETHVEEIISSFTNTNIIVWDELTETEKMALFDHSYPSQLSFSSISPTKYKVYVQGIDSPTTLVFTQMYDDGWKLSNTSSRRAYGMLNSFRIDSDGEYTLIYTPQKYVDLGFTISVISIVLAIASLIYLEKGNLENKHD